MTTESALTWRKASYSGNADGNCVEVARTATRTHLRDSKDCAAGTQRYDISAWTAFEEALRRLGRHP